MATAGELDIIVRLKSTIARDLKPIRQSLKGLAQDIELGRRPVSIMRDLFGGLRQTIFSTTGILVGAAAAVAGLTYFIKQSIPAATEYGLAMGGLESAAKRFGHSADIATEAAMRLSEDGLITPRTAAEGLKRLLITGLGLPEATKLMKAYIDMAAFGRSTSLDMNQAILNLSQSFVTERSMLADNSGMYENYKEIVEAGANALGKKTSALNYSERRMAKYLGTLMVATRAEGDAARLTETYAGTMAKLSNAMYMLKVVVGSLVIPILSKLAGWLTTVLKAATALIARLAPSWLEMGMDMVKGSTAGIGAISDLRKQFDELGGTASDTAKRIKRAMEDFAYATKNALRDFKRRLADLVFAHRDKVASLKKQLEEETRNLQERILKMQEPYEELKKNAIQAGKERLANLKAQLDKELAKGKNTNWEKVRMLQDFIAEEKIAIDKSIKEWDDKAQAEIDIEVAKGQARIDSIKDELAKEEAILQRHADIIGTIKELQREDDIARLIRQTGEQRAELDRRHRLTMEDIRGQGAEAGAAAGTGIRKGFRDALLRAGEKVFRLIRSAFAALGFGTELGEDLAHGIVEGTKATTAELLWVGRHIMNAISIGAKTFAGGAYELGKNVARGIVDGIAAISSSLVWAGKHVMNMVTSGMIDWARVTKAIGGRVAHAVRMLGFQEGGVVPGRIGEPRLAVVHGGERIIPADRRGGEVTQTFNVTVQSPWDFQLMMERAAIMARRGMR